MTEKTEWGFPKGNVAETLRRILGPKLTAHEVEAITVCLMSHLMLENRITSLLYKWLKQSAPLEGTDEKQDLVDNTLWSNIAKMDFAKKFSLIEPFLSTLHPAETKTFWKINDLRNTIFHGKALGDAKYEGGPISDEATVEKIFMAAQFAGMALDKLEELIERPKILAEKWAARLKELKEPLF